MIKKILLIILIITLYSTQLIHAETNKLTPNKIKTIKENSMKKNTLKSYSYLAAGSIGLGISAASNPAFLGVALPIVGYGSYLKFYKPSTYSLIKSTDDTYLLPALKKQAKYSRYKNSVILTGLSFYTYIMMKNDMFEKELPDKLTNTLPFISIVPLSISIFNLSKKSYFEKKINSIDFKNKSSIDSFKAISKISDFNRKKTGIKTLTLGLILSSIAVKTDHTNLLPLSVPTLSLGIYNSFLTKSLSSKLSNLDGLTQTQKEEYSSSQLKKYARHSKIKRLILATGLAGASYYLATQKDDEYLIEHELYAISFITGSLALFNYSFNWPLESIAKSYDK